MNENGPSMMPRNWRWRWGNFKGRFWGWLLEDQWGKGLGGPPNNWQSSGDIEAQRWSATEARLMVIGFVNDAHEIGIYSKWPDYTERNHSWDVHMPAHVFRRMALWYLWRWVAGEWFGLRRWLFYKRLSRRMAEHKRRFPRPPHL